jgi:hypothetical protein
VDAAFLQTRTTTELEALMFWKTSQDFLIARSDNNFTAEMEALDEFALLLENTDSQSIRDRIHDLVKRAGRRIEFAKSLTRRVGRLMSAREINQVVQDELA